jgi:hypothetical protein
MVGAPSSLRPAASRLGAFRPPQVLLFSVPLAHLRCRYVGEPARLFCMTVGRGCPGCCWARPVVKADLQQTAPTAGALQRSLGPPPQDGSPA